jgi:uncharacterized protein
MQPELTTLLAQLQAELQRTLGDNLIRAILYGSRARGDAAPDSDVDILIVLRQAEAVYREAIHRVAYDLMWHTDFQFVLALNIIDLPHYTLLQQHRSSYLANVEREGQVL